jgi:hypothetical protein
VAARRSALQWPSTPAAGVRQLLLSSGLGLDEHNLDVDLEAPVPGGLRIDVEVGFTVIEFKKDLRGAAVVKAAKKQLAGYVASRSEQTGQRYVGILTDGADWRAYHLQGKELVEATGANARTPTPFGAHSACGSYGHGLQGLHP